MTVSTTTSRWEYVGNGATTAFAYDNRIFADTDLSVYVDGTQQTLTTDYTVSGAGTEDGGNVTFGTPPASAASVVIVREVPATQPQDYERRGQVDAEALERALDRATVLIQQLNTKVTRSVILEDSTAYDGSLALPAAVANGVLAFNADADALETKLIVDIGGAAFPASALDGQHALFDGTSGTALKAGRKALEAATFVDLASAGTVDIGDQDSDFVNITGTTTITSLGEPASGYPLVWVKFAAALTLTHNATSLILPGADDITTAAGDVAAFKHEGSGNWRCVGYVRADGTAVVAVVAASGLVNQAASLLGTVDTSTTVIPFDNTSPQNTEGEEFTTLAYTPADAANTLEIECVLNFSVSAAVGVAVTLFAGDGLTALAAGAFYAADNDWLYQVRLLHRMAAGGTGEITFKMRYGPSAAATVTANGVGGSGIFNARLQSGITLREYRS